MQPLRLALAPDGPKRLEVVWQGRWKNLTLSLDGAPVLTVPTEGELKAGREVKTAAGTLGVQLKAPAFSRQLWLTVDGRPIPGTAADPTQRLRQSYGVLYFVGGLSLVAGAADLAGVDALRDMGFGLVSLGIGGVIGILAAAVHLLRSRVALGLAMALIVLDTVAGIVGAFYGGSNGPASGLVVRVMILLYVARGFPALSELRARQGSGR